MPCPLWLFSLGVNWSGLGTTSTTNHKFYRALAWLHDPWCKHILKPALYFGPDWGPARTLQKIGPIRSFSFIEYAPRVGLEHSVILCDVLSGTIWVPNLWASLKKLGWFNIAHTHTHLFMTIPSHWFWQKDSWKICRCPVFGWSCSLSKIQLLLLSSTFLHTCLRTTYAAI